MPAKAIPQGFHTITPYLTVRNATQAIEFYKKAFGAEILGVMHQGDAVIHAALKIGDSILMLNDEFPQMGSLSPLSTNGSGIVLHIYTENVDAAFERATSAGATVAMPLADQFWGDRYGMVTDPYGHKWAIAAHIRDMSGDEIRKAQEAAFAQMPKSA
jgi:PhnB protein